MRETLHCERGNHPWERQSARGRKPRSCNSPVCDVPNPELVPAEIVPTAVESTEPNSTTSDSLLPSLSGSERARVLVERMALLHEKNAQRLRVKPKP